MCGSPQEKQQGAMRIRIPVARGQHSKPGLIQPDQIKRIMMASY
jgi:hypothetical protein